MSTDFIKNAVSLMGGILPTSTNTPGDVRTRVKTEADIMDIPNPYIGMVVYVLDTGKRFEVLTLKDKVVGMTLIKNAAVDTYRDITIDLSELAAQKDLHQHNNLELLSNITETDISRWNAKSDFSGSYLDLSDLPNIPANVSDLNNDLSFATETFVLNKIAEAELNDKEVDLSGYVTHDDLRDYAKLIDLSDYVTRDVLDNYYDSDYVDYLIDNHDHETISESEIEELID